MGISASQARLLSITARISDVEYKSQNLSNTKIRLSDESETASKAYTDALDKQKYTFVDYSQGTTGTTISLNSTTLLKYASQYKLINNSTGEAVSLYDAKSNPNGLKFDETTLYEMIESGQYRLQSAQTQEDNTTKFVDINPSTDLSINSEKDTTAIAKAEAEYDATLTKIKKKEQMIDNELNTLDTEHNALSTEYDSIKSLIGDNVESSFNLFS